MVAFTEEFWILVLSVVPVMTEYITDIRRRLVTDQLKDYKPQVHPRYFVNELIGVEVNFYLLSLIEINEKEQSLTTSGWLKLRWDDVGLAWNMSDFNVTDVYLKQKDIWVPDTVIANSLTEIKPMGYSDLLISVTSDGKVQWNPGNTYKTKCEMDITYFPFDSQTCNITVSVWMSSSEMQLNLSTEYVYVARDAENSLWNINNVSKHLRADNDYYTYVIDIVIVLTRCPNYYILNIMLPVVCISALIPLVFILPIDLGDRVSLTVTIVLSFVVFLTVLSDNLPRTSRQTSYLTIHITIQLFLSALTVILSVVTLKISSLPDRKPIPSCKGKTSTTRTGHSIKNKTQPVNEDEASVGNQEIQRLTVEDDKQCHVTWKDVSNRLDKVLFVVFFLLILITNVTFFFLMTVFQNK